MFNRFLPEQASSEYSPYKKLVTSFDLPANQTEWGPADEPMFVQCELHIDGLYCSELHGGG